jgi:uncharacterized membrane protein YeaQ/YmgE (transglycosylase-associated protein family)
MILSVIAWIVFGASAGWLASLITHTENSQDAVDDELVGIIGALIGGFMAKVLSGTSLTAFDISSMVAAVIGSAALLVFFKTVRHPHTSV